MALEISVIVFHTIRCIHIWTQRKDSSRAQLLLIKQSASFCKRGYTLLLAMNPSSG